MSVKNGCENGYVCWHKWSLPTVVVVLPWGLRMWEAAQNEVGAMGRHEGDGPRAQRCIDDGLTMGEELSNMKEER